jgi:Leucine-rich repeat (LRR) protein
MSVKPGVVHTDPDIDGDRIRNELEDRAGLDPFDASDALLDPDGDTFNNAEELNSNTDHTDAASTPSAGVLELQILETHFVEDGGFAEAKLHRVLGAAGVASVDFTTLDSDTAIAGTDYVATSQTVTWLAGEVGVKVIQIPLIDDEVYETAENIRLQLSNPSAGARLGVRDGAIWVYEDDHFPADFPGFVGMSANNRVGESAGYVDVSLIRYNGRQGAVAVDVFASSDPASNFDTAATEGDDFEQPLVSTVSWADGEAGVKTVRLPILDDDLDEASEDFYVNLHNNTGGLIIAWQGESVTIVDDDVIADEGLIGFTGRRVNAFENLGYVDVDLARRHGSTGEVSTTLFIVPGSAQAGSDYVDLVPPVLVSWPDGDSSVQTVRLDLVNDATLEAIENLFPVIGTVTGGARLDRDVDANGFSANVIVLFDSGDVDENVDSDGDGVPNVADRDDDNDGVFDVFDAFPLDDTETDDTDGDNVGDNTDDDIDGDGISNDDELALGLDPFDGGDAFADQDGDGADAYTEFIAGTDIFDAGDTPAAIADALAGIPDAELQSCIVDHGPTFVVELTDLDCNWRPIGDLSGIEQLTSLEVIYLDGTNAVNYAALALIPGLEMISANDSQFGDVDLAAFAAHGAIESLSLSNAQVTDISPLASVPTIRELHLWGDETRVYDFGFLAGSPVFDTLGVNANQVSDLNDLLALPALNRLWTNGLTAADVTLLASGLPATMELISFSWSLQIGDAQLAEIVAAFPDLLHLEIVGTNVTDLTPVFGLAQLEQLHLDFIPMPDDVQANDLRGLGVVVFGDAAGGVPIADAIDGIDDYHLRQCLVGATDGMLLSGQLTGFGCRDGYVLDLAGLWQFHNLNHLDLGNNGIRNIGDLGGMNSLGFVDLGGTFVSDLSPLFGLPEVNHVVVQDLPLYDPGQTDPANFANNPFIDGFAKPGLDITDPGFDMAAIFPDVDLRACVQMEIDNVGATFTSQVHHLDCSDYNGYNVTDLTGLDQFPAIYDLQLNNNHGDPDVISDFSVLGNLGALSSLGVDSHPFGNGDLFLVNGQVGLQYLAIGNTDVTDLSPLSATWNLREVHLWNSTTYDLSSLFGLPLFDGVALDVTQLQDVNHIGGFPQLRKLWLNGFLTGDVVANILAQAGTLEHLAIGGNPTVDGALVTILTSGLPNLNSFGAGYSSLSDLASIVGFGNIESLDVAGTLVSDYTLAIASGTLMQIHIQDAPISDADVLTLEGNGVQVDGTPLPADQSADTDGDGTINRDDLDDDGDLILDERELAYGLDPLDPADALLDPDVDGFNNAEEANSGSDINDIGSVPGAGILEFQTARTHVAEDVGFATITLHRMLGAAGAVSVDLTASDTFNALDGVDYVATTETATWGPGEMGAKTVLVEVLDDAIDEAVEHVNLALSNPTGGAQLGHAQGQLVIFDDNYQPAHPGFLGTDSGVTVEEGAGFVDVTLTRFGGSLGQVSVAVNPQPIGGTFDRPAFDGSDYLSPANNQLIWADGEDGRKTVRIPILDDADDEMSEVFFLHLDNAIGGVLIAWNDVRVSVTDDDVFAPEGVLTFTARSFWGSETQGYVDVDVTRRYGTSGEVSADIFALLGFTNALPDADFIAPPPVTLTWPDGDDSVQTVRFDVLDDAIEEGDETFLPWMNNIMGGARNDRDGVVGWISNYDDIPLLDADGDGSIDQLDYDRDGDGVENQSDAFPDDSTRSSDIDGDNIPDEDDEDRDGDDIDNDEELALGLDPDDGGDVYADPDGDGANTLAELEAGTDPFDDTSTPALLAGILPGIPDAELQACISDTGATYVAEVIDLDCNWRPIGDLSGIELLSNLEAVYLDGTNAVNYAALALIPGLEMIVANQSQFGDADFAAFAGHGIEAFHLGDAQVTDIAPAGSMPNLEELQLWGDHTRIYDFSVLSGNANFRALGLSRNQVQDINFLLQGHLPGLRELRLNNVSVADVLLMTDPVTGLPIDMELLAVHWSLQVGDAELAALAAAFPNLHTLEFRGTNVTDLTPLFGMPDLSFVDIDYVPLPDSVQANQLRNLGVDVHGDPAGGAPMADAINGVDDYHLRQCLVGATGDMLVSGQLTGLGCHDGHVLNIYGLWQFHNLDHLDIPNNGITDIGDLGALNRLGHVNLAGNPVMDISALFGRPNLNYVNVDGLPLHDPGQADSGNFANNPFVDGFANPGLDILDPGFDMAAIFPDASLRACVQGEIDALGATWTSQIQHLDCSDHTGYNVTDLTGLDQFPAILNLQINNDHGDPDVITDFSVLGSLGALDTLAVDGQPFNDGDLYLVNLGKRLQYLQIGNTDLTDLSPLSITWNLREAHLWGSTVWDLSPLFGLPLFEGVFASREQIDIDQLSSIPGLRRLWLHGPLLPGDIGIITSFDLVALSLCCDGTLGTADFFAITQSQPNLDYLEFHSTALDDLTGVTDLPMLTGLDIQRTFVSDLTLLFGHPSLTWLNIEESPVMQAQIDTLVADGVDVVGTPLPAEASADTDGDGVINLLDLDDDGDLILDVRELAYGLDPLDPADALLDPDSDTFNNAEEANSGSDINDDTSIPGAGIVEFQVARPAVTEDVGFATITLHRILGAAGAVSVDLTQSDTFNAFDGVDYVASIETATWAPGEVGAKTLQIEVIGDAIDEVVEQVNLMLTNPTGGVRLGNAQGQLVILDDNFQPAHPGFLGTESMVAVEEGAGFIDVTLNRFGGSLGQVSVVVNPQPTTGTFDRPAFDGADYHTPVNNRLIWADGEAGTKTLRIPIIDDGDDEMSEVFFLHLDSVTGGAELPWNDVRVTIIDNDVFAPEGVLAFTARSFWGSESQGYVDVDITRRYGTTGEVSADIFALLGFTAALPDADFIAPAPVTLTWPDGDDSVQTVRFDVLDDDIEEFDETFLPWMNNITGGARNDRDGAVGWITNYDDIPLLDSDGDGTIDALDHDRDGDGVNNAHDPFPDDGTRFSDLDGDNIPDEDDEDRDGDGIDNDDELILGLDPDDGGDAFADDDGDGANSITELAAGTDPLDDSSVPLLIADIMPGIPDAELQACIFDHGVTFVAELWHLDCNWRPIADFTGVSQLGQLESISVDGTNATNYGELALIPGLESIAANQSQFGDADFAAFAGHGIREFHLGDAQVTDIAPAGSMANLEELQLWGDHTRIYDFSVLSGNANFRALGLSRNQVQDINFLLQGHLPGLRELRLNNVSMADVLLMTDPVTGLPVDMELLAVHWSLQVGDAELAAIVAALPNLHTLEFRGTNVTDLTPLFGMPNLTNIDIDYVPLPDSVQANQLRNLGVAVHGNPAGGAPMADAINGVDDYHLRQCLVGATGDMMVSGQLTGLGCHDGHVLNIYGLWQFHNLDHVDMPNNGITDIGDLGALNRLGHVNLAGNHVMDISALFGHPNLNYVNVDGLPLHDPNQADPGNFANNPFVDGFANPGLDILDPGFDMAAIFPDASLRACVQAEIDGLGATWTSQIQYLDCSDYNGFNVTDLTGLDQFPAIYQLQINNNHGDVDAITDFSVLGGLGALERLGVDGHPFTDGDLYLVNLGKRLQFLHIGNTDVTDLTPLSITWNLLEVHLWHSTTYDLSSLFGLPLFEGVALDVTQLQDVNHIGGFPQLRKLWLNGLLTADVVANIVVQAGTLEHLAIGGVPTVDDTLVTILTSQLPNLNSFGAGYSSLSDLASIVGFGNIESLDVASTLVSDYTLAIASDTLMQIHIQDAPISEADVLTLEGNGVQVDGTPLPAEQSADTDGDGTINRDDLDDDGDLILDERELAYGLDPLDPADALLDPDVDGFNNAEEANSGSDINDIGSVPNAGLVEFQTARIHVAEDVGFATVTLHRILGAAGAVSVDLAQSDTFNAFDGVDYVASLETATWGPGEMGAKTVQIEVIGDAIDEVVEQVRLTLSNPTGGAQLGHAQAQLVIFDDNYQPAHPGFLGTDSMVSVEEGAGFLDVTVNRFGGSFGQVSVAINPQPTSGTFDRPAFDGADFQTPANNLLTWADGEAGAKMLRIPIVDDGDDEMSEVFFLHLDNPTGGAILGWNDVRVSITDNDVFAPEGVLTFTARSFWGSETLGYVDVDITRRYGTTGEVSADIFALLGFTAALPDADFIAPAPVILTWPDGDDSIQTVRFDVLDDGIKEFDETFLPWMNNITGGARNDRNGAVGWITNYDDLDPLLDSDGDGTIDELDFDRDGDGVNNEHDPFPDDGTRFSDIDGDNIPDEDDEDRDGDGVDNVDEPGLGLDPDDGGDAFADDDGDGANTITELAAGTDPLDDTDVPQLLADIMPGIPDVELQACIFDHGQTFVAEMRHLDCNWRPLVDLTGIDQLLFLEEVYLDGINAVNFAALALIPGLEIVVANQSQFGDADFAAFAGHGIHELHLGDAQVTDIAPAGSMANLEELQLWGDHTRIYDFSVLSGNANFRALGLSRNQVLDINFLLQGHLPGLRELRLNNVSMADVLLMTDPVTGLPMDMELLAVHWSLQVGDAELAALAAAFPNLHTLEFRGTNVTDLTPLFGMPALFFIDIDYAPIPDNVQANQLRNQGVEVNGDPAGGAPMADAIDGVEDYHLRQCLVGATGDMLVSGQLTGLGCHDGHVLNIFGLWQFHNLDHLDIPNNGITDIGDLGALNRLGHVNMAGNPVMDISALFGRPNLNYVNVDGLPLHDPNQADPGNFANNPFVDGFANPGLDILDPGFDMAAIFPDASLRACVQGEIDALGATWTSQIQHLDCSDHTGYNVTDLTGLDQFPAILNLQINNDHGDPDVITDFSVLGSLGALDTLAVDGQPFNDGDLYLVNLGKRLQYLQIGNTDLTDLSPLSITWNLREAHLWGSTVWDLSPLFGLPLFEGVFASREQIDIDQLGSIPGLRRLWLHGALMPGDIGIITSLDLVALSLCCDSNLGSADFFAITQSQPNLDYLEFHATSLDDLTGVTDLTLLTGLGINNTIVSDLSLLFGHPSLTWLNIDGVPVPQSDIDTLVGAGVEVDGARSVGAVISSLVFADAELTACVMDTGVQVTDLLTELDCNWRPIGDLAGIGQLDFLEFVSLDGTNAVNYAELATIPSLRSVNVNQSLFGDAAVVAFTGHGALELLSAGNAEVTDIGPLGTIPTLAELHVWGDETRIYDFSIFAGSPVFHSLGVNANQVSDLNDLLALPALNQLWMNGLTAVDVTLLTGGLPATMELISFSWSQEIGDPQLVEIAAAFPGLRHLEIVGTNVTDLTPIVGFPLEQLHIDLVPLADPAQLGLFPGVTIFGEVAGGVDVASIDIPDPTLSNCVDAHMAGLLQSGQLTWLDCRDSPLIELAGIEVFNHLQVLVLSNTGIRDLSAVGGLSRLREVHIADSLVREISVLHGMPSIEFVDLNQIPLEDPNQQFGFDPAVAISGAANPGDDIATISAAFAASDIELQACFDDQVLLNPHWLFASQVHGLDCSPHAGYNLTSIAEISRLFALDWFTINDSSATLADLSPLAGIKALDSLNASNSNMTNADLAGISTLVRLGDVSIGGTTVTDISPLSASVNLRMLHLWGVATFELDDLFGLPSFNGIAMSRNQLIDINDLVLLPQLENLWLHGALDPADMTLVTGLSDLKHLSVGSDVAMGNTQFDQITASLTGLQSLDFVGSPLNDISTVTLLPGLSILDIQSTDVTSLSVLFPMAVDNGGPLTQVHIHGLILADPTEKTTLQGLGVLVEGP